MQVHMDIHKYAKVYEIDIPWYTQIYSGIYVNETCMELEYGNRKIGVRSASMLGGSAADQHPSLPH